MTFEQQNELIKSNIHNFEKWQLEDILKQMKSYNTNLGAYDEIIEYIQSNLDNRK